MPRYLPCCALILLALLYVGTNARLGTALAQDKQDPHPTLEQQGKEGEREQRDSRRTRRALQSEQFKQRLLPLYDVSNPQIDLDKLFAPGVMKDGIPALTTPPHVLVNAAVYPTSTGRVVALEINGTARAYPLGILNWHEIVNDELGGVPVAVTYCPLCDSVSVLDRRLKTTAPDGTEHTTVVEFGVSGLLYNSNVVMYERTTMGLWSQVYMQGVTGPHAGKSLTHLPVVMMTFAQFKERYPAGHVLTTNTGHQRPYDKNPYADYFTSDRLFIEMEFGDALPAKTLGLGIKAGKTITFVTAEAAMAQPITIDTSLGRIIINSNPASGIQVTEAPDGARIVQTFYHSWSAFYPTTEVVTADTPKTGER